MNNNTSDTVRWLSIVNIVLGVWLVVSPFLFIQSTAVELWNSIVLGLVVIALAVISLTMPTQRWTNIANGIAGLWLIVAPFFLAFTTVAAFWNTIILGILIAAVSFISSYVSYREESTPHRVYRTHV